MNYSKVTTQFVDQLISNYVHYDKYDITHFYITDVPDFDMDELSALIMIDNPDYAFEATSIDNPFYESIMQPALINYLSDSTNKDKEIDFNNNWKKGIRLYFEKTISDLFDDRFSEINVSTKYNYSSQEACQW